ncbi:MULTISPECIES: ABC transporter permease [Paenibacillus]|uniref:Glycine/betaine ABC transporter permease n=2 Tax=Paenibacillus TaxID=44249 RepID=A0ABX2ZKB0_PAEPO|nr:MULTISPECIES: ABC transporter permease [Paenibacillus]AIW39994.1 glycine/betaine ABC transporter permease [Paenibacillus polymyxa CR1]ALA42301.1 glycine/betaine ABC transporter permease [Paenibacillus peoriae]APQ59483.1 glycine/betaine ABC transporter permease [Paenibacillus polymyxa]MCP3747696.1 ABC transporter permease [Paenibacillus sp. A3M_27_13]MDR6775827.1 osmoprotectant transport system permease protein [Paenibacillus peoriae]
MNDSLWMQLTAYFSNNMHVFLATGKEHIIISLLALLCSASIGIVLGYVTCKYKRTEKWIVSLFQVLRIMPSLAVLLLLIPIMGTGTKPALIALVLLGIPPILMNMIAGLESVPSFLLEAAHGVGMSEQQVMWRVKFPLAAPMILTGIKIAAIEVIASATLAAKIGAGGLGEIIFTGLGLNRVDLLLIGGFSVGILAITVGVMLDMSERILFKYRFLKR